MEAKEQQVLLYRTTEGRIPYLEWFHALKDMPARHKIDARIGRLRLGNFGIARSVGDGVNELKIDYGPGYRVYFARYGEQIVILLLGGDKRTQNEDINKAKAYWSDYKVRVRRVRRRSGR